MVRLTLWYRYANNRVRPKGRANKHETSRETTFAKALQGFRERKPRSRTYLTCSTTTVPTVVSSSVWSPFHRFIFSCVFQIHSPQFFKHTLPSFLNTLAPALQTQSPQACDSSYTNLKNDTFGVWTIIILIDPHAGIFVRSKRYGNAPTALNELLQHAVVFVYCCCMYVVCCLRKQVIIHT